MNYFVWEPYIEGYEYSSALEVMNLSINDASKILCGVRLELIPEQVAFASQTPGEVPDVMSTGGTGLLVSTGVKNILERFCDHESIQFIPAKLEETPNSKKWLINCISIEACIDRQRSKLTTFADSPDGIDGIECLIPLPLEDAPALFHMQELITIFVVREDLMQALKDYSETVARFIPLTEFTRHATE